MTQEPTAPDLRDQMAMAALTGLLASQTTQRTMDVLNGVTGGKLLSQAAYMIAAAMLAERNRTTKGEDHV
jgi:hypothetical protein